MILPIAAAVGTGATCLAAFDDALLKIGAANFNIIRLSSVIPPGSEVVARERAMELPQGAWGDRLYAVCADRRANRPGEQAWAGIGWIQDASGRGLFVEHSGQREQQVHDDIDASLDQLAVGRGLRFGSHQRLVVGTTVVDRPVCALVMCAYATESWSPT
jgi:arginine decarboxylase